jgi:uncharacterized protein YybS (DUF2232 family)
MILQTVQYEILTKLYKNMPINDIASAIEPLRRTAHRVYSVILLILSLLAVFIFVLGAISWRNLNTGGFVHRGLSVCFFFCYCDNSILAVCSIQQIFVVENLPGRKVAE